MKARGLMSLMGSLWLVGTAHGAGFALIEQNASGMGNAYAGAAAVAEDASTIFFNPAGLTLQQGTQAVAALHAIGPSAKFSNGGSVAATMQALGGNGGDAGGWAAVPNLYLAMDLRPGVRFGLGINAPFGLKTEYDPSWTGRFQAVTSDLKTLNVNPTLAFKLNDAWSLGIGLNAQQVKAELSNKANYSAFIAVASGGGILTPNLEGLGVVKGDDWSWGGNIGLLYAPSADLRVGANYRSAIKYKLEGTASFSNVPVTVSPAVNAALAAQFAAGPVTASVKMPDTFSLSLFKALDTRWDLLADATWTNWNVFKTLAVVRSSGAPLSSTAENWKSTWRYSLGANFHPNRNMTWRFGVAYDPTPVPDANRTPRIPDESRTLLALGGQYRYSKHSAVDFGYAHLFVKDATINSTVAGAGTLNGTYDNHVDILSVQYTHSF